MKWSSTAAAVVVLAVSAPVHADLVSRYQQEHESSASGHGPEFALPNTAQETSTLAPADGGKDKNKKNEDKKPNKRPSKKPQAEARDDASAGAAVAPRPPADSSVLGETLPAMPYGGSSGSGAMHGSAYGQSHAGRDYGSAQHCCDEFHPKAKHVWDDYCSSKQMCLPHGWLVRRYNCDHCVSCPTPARPLFAGWGCKPHFGWISFRGAAPACEGCAPAACESCEPAACASNEGCETCDACAAAPCERQKSGGLLSRLFARSSAKHDCGCAVVEGCASEECCDSMTSADMGEGEIYHYDSEAGELPIPAPPVVPMDNPAAEADAKSARHGLWPDALRLFPIGR